MATKPMETKSINHHGGMTNLLRLLVPIRIELTCTVILVLLTVLIVVFGGTSLQAIIRAVTYGIVNACLYMNITIGMTLLWSMMGIMNFAHGSIFMLGGVLLWQFLTRMGTPYALAVVSAIVLVALFGFIIERVVYRQLQGREGQGEAVLVAFLGLDILLVGCAYLILGPVTRNVPSLFSGTWHLGPVALSQERLAVIPITVVLLIGLYFLLFRTRLGLAIRAIREDSQAAALQAINIRRINMMVFALSFSLAAIAGVLYVPLSAIDPNIGARPLLLSFIIIIIGGLGSLRGAIVGSVLVALVEGIITVTIGSDESYLLLFMFVFVLLLVRPRGLYGRDET